jgi:hypothetical protein
MLRDNLVGLIEPMLSSAGAYPLALSPEWNRSSDDRPPCLENPRPEGAESTLTENALSPFHAEPKQLGHCALGLVHMSAGNYAEAIRELQNAPLTHSTFGWRGCAYVRAGQRDKGEELLRQIERARQQTYVSPQPLFTLNLVRSVPRSNAWRQPSRPGTFNSITCNRTRYSTDFDLMCVIRICSAE